MKTKVIFRIFPKEKDVIALFPEVQGDMSHAYCGSYMHIGQHGAAAYGLIAETKPATPKEYAALQSELESIGYVLEIRKRIGKRWHEVNQEGI
jgi:hypothetical protein